MRAPRVWIKEHQLLSEHHQRRTMTIQQNWNILTLHQRQRFVFNQVREWFSFIWKTLFNSWIHWKPIPHNLLRATSWSDYQSLTYRGFSWQKTEDASPCPHSPSPACWEGYRAPQVSPHPAQRSRWCASATAHPQTRDQRPFLDGALHKRGPAWLSPARLKALQTAAFAWGKRNLQKQQGR